MPKSYGVKKIIVKTGERQIQEAIEIRSEYTKMGYETFVADSKRIAEMYNELSKIALKPFGAMSRENVPSDR